MDMRRFGESIAKARKKRNLTQEELAARIGVTTQAVSKWENGHNLPDIENVMRIAEITNTQLLAFDIARKLGEDYDVSADYLRDVIDAKPVSPDRFGLFMDHAFFSAVRLYRELTGQDGVAGLRSGQVDALSAILLHDVVEDTGVSAEELPFSGEVRTIVDLVSFSVPEGQTKAEAKKAYYERIRNNAKACVVKLLDRCNNVSTMAGSFPRGRMVEYIEETEQYILPLASVLKNEYPEYSDLAFLSKYQILSVLETIKYLITE